MTETPKNEKYHLSALADSSSKLYELLLHLKSVTAEEGELLYSVKKNSINSPINNEAVAVAIDNSEVSDDVYKNEEFELCNCKRTMCLKMYCQCFAARRSCLKTCRCVNCKNNDSHEPDRNEAIKAILDRNPNAFDSKFKPLNHLMGTVKPVVGHKIGCRCRKSQCLKKYCECFQGSVACTSSCTCYMCQNTVENLPKLSARKALEGFCLPSEPLSRECPINLNSENNERKRKLETLELNDGFYLSKPNKLLQCIETQSKCSKIQSVGQEFGQNLIRGSTEIQLSDTNNRVITKSSTPSILLRESNELSKIDLLQSMSIQAIENTPRFIQLVNYSAGIALANLSSNQSKVEISPLSNNESKPTFASNNLISIIELNRASMNARPGTSTNGHHIETLQQLQSFIGNMKHSNPVDSHDAVDNDVVSREDVLEKINPRGVTVKRMYSVVSDLEEPVQSAPFLSSSSLDTVVISKDAKKESKTICFQSLETLSDISYQKSFEQDKSINKPPVMDHDRNLNDDDKENLSRSQRDWLNSLDCLR